MANGLISCRAGARVIRLVLETLEPRLAMSGVQPTATEQLFLEQLNDLRANPAAYGAAIGLPAIYGVRAAEPLAWDSRLIQAARQHSQDMKDTTYFGHVDSAGHNPGWRIDNAGFPWTAYDESIAAGYATTAAALKALIVDAGIPDLGHRLHLLALNNSDKSIGIGVALNANGAPADYYTLDSANTTDYRAFVTGVVFNDADGNGKYGVGEGVAGVTVTVAGAGSVAAFDAGGYSLQLNPGTYTVTASGGGLATPITQTVTVGSTNVRLNFLTSNRTQVNSAPNNLLQIAGTFTHSTENFQRFVTNAYRTYLQRTPDSAGVNYWVNRMAQGMTDEQLEASFVGSDEYVSDHGGASAAWVKDIYQNLLGRSASQAEIDHWLQQMAQGLSTNDVAYGFAASPEREGERISKTYQDVLGRRATADEVHYWVNRFEQGATNEDVAAGFIASPEFYNNAGKGNVIDWLQAMYQDLLHRVPTGGELVYWQTQMR